jgi:hypothetical protein
LVRTGAPPPTPRTEELIEFVSPLGFDPRQDTSTAAFRRCRCFASVPLGAGPTSGKVYGFDFEVSSQVTSTQIGRAPVRRLLAEKPARVTTAPRLR